MDMASRLKAVDNAPMTNALLLHARDKEVPGIPNRYPEYRLLGMTGLWGDVSDAASTSDNTQAAMVPAH
jgi:hypothetical protein